MKINLKDFNKQEREKIKTDVNILKKKGIQPTLSIILIWNDKWAEIYSNTKKKLANTLWVTTEITKFWDNVTQEDVNNTIEEINIDKTKHWIIIESPVPEQIDYDQTIWLINPLKDVDWLHPNNLWKILSKDINWVLPATPQSCLKILEYIWESIKGKNIAIIWRWRTVWLPLSTILTNMWATITSCNSHTKEIKKICQKADIIITATWQKNLITKDMINEKSIIIDAWINVDNEWIISWDVNFENTSKIAKYITPVPWGVWPTTTTTIFSNLIKLIKEQQNNKTNDFDLSLNSFIKLSKWPKMPWWWWISCISAIHWASMISMVASLTKDIDQNKYINNVNKLIEQLKELYEEDINNFELYLKTLKNKANNKEEKTKRKEKLEFLSKELCYIPIKIAKLWIEIIKIGKELEYIWNINVLSDIKVWINIATASIKSALEPIDINTKFIKDEKNKIKILNETKTILEKIKNI